MYSLCHLFGRSETNSRPVSQLPSDNGYMKQDGGRVVDYAPVRPSPLRGTAIHANLANGSSFVRPRTADLRSCANPIFPRSSASHTQNTDVGDPLRIRSLQYNPRRVTHPTLLQSYPTRQVRSRDGTGPITPGKKTRYRARYRVRKQMQMQMQNLSPPA